MLLESALLAKALVATALAAAQAVKLRRHLVRVDRQLSWAEERRREALRMQRAQQQLVAAQGLAEAAVAGGTELVRTVHKGIAEVPFTILESIPATRQPTRVVRQTHDLIADVAYDTVGAVNKGIGKLLRKGLTGQLKPPFPETREAPPESPPREADPQDKPPRH
jgi:hypothetical protein